MDFSPILVIVGAIAFIGYLVWLIVRSLNWDSKIPPIIGMLLCAIMIVGGLSTMNITGDLRDPDSKDNDQENQIENEELLAENDVGSEDTNTEVQPPEQEDVSSDGYQIMFGELLNANPSGGIDGKTLVIKAKIHSQMTNNMTVTQNYHNVEDIIKNQGGDKFDCIDYWAVADMSDGSEQKVVAFTVDSKMIKNVADGNIVATQFEDYVDDLFIHQSLRNQ